MIRRLPVLTAVAAALATAAAPAVASADSTSVAAPAAAPTLLRLDGIGPLRLGMQRTAALRTGWLARRGRGCELGGPPLPITYQLTGASAPRGIVGTAEFNASSGKLGSIVFRSGVRTATGVVVGRTTATDMVNRYKDAGFSARAQFIDTFAGTFANVTRRGKQVIGGFARGRPSARRPIESLGIPFVPVCE